MQKSSVISKKLVIIKPHIGLICESLPYECILALTMTNKFFSNNVRSVPLLITKKVLNWNAFAKFATKYNYLPQIIIYSNSSNKDTSPSLLEGGVTLSYYFRKIAELQFVLLTPETNKDKIDTNLRNLLLIQDYIFVKRNFVSPVRGHIHTTYKYLGFKAHSQYSKLLPLCTYLPHNFLSDSLKRVSQHNAYSGESLVCAEIAEVFLKQGDEQQQSHEHWRCPTHEIMLGVINRVIRSNNTIKEPYSYDSEFYYRILCELVIVRTI
jgi:hypothetical protein